PSRAGHDGARPRQSEYAVNRQPEPDDYQSSGHIRGHSSERCTELLETRPLERRDGDDGLPAHATRAQALGHLAADQLEPFRFREAAFRQDGDAPGHPQQLNDREMLLRLRHDSVVGGDYEEGDVNAGGAG